MNNNDKIKALEVKIKALEAKNKRLTEVINYFLFMLTGLLKLLGLSSFDDLKTMSKAQVAKSFLKKVTTFEKLNFTFADFSIYQIELRLNYLFNKSVIEYTESVLPIVEVEFNSHSPHDARN